MSVLSAAAPLRFPHAVPPEPGGMVEIAPGVLWLRLALPFQLDHENIYLIEDDGGWAIIDTGLADDRTRAVWAEVLDRRLGGRRPTRLIVTHCHPDHVGLAGWFAARHGLPLFMSQTDYLMAQTLRHDPAAGAAPHRDFFTRHGLRDAAVEALLGRGHAYLRMTVDLPPSYIRLRAGETIDIGGRRFAILTGAGHAPEQVMLLSREDGLFFAADQVLAKISPNIGVWPWEPLADPLGDYLRSLAELRAAVPPDALVLAAHNLPFHGLPTRIEELQRHHDARCDDIAAACARGPHSVAELVPVLFPRPLDAHQTGFAFGETLAHVNRMVARGELAMEAGPDGTLLVRAR